MKLREIFNEVQSITTVDLGYKATNILEKLLWAIVGLIGTIWAFYFVAFQFMLWNENPSIISQDNADLSDIRYPAVTFCSKGATKYAVAERLGNYMDPEADIFEKFPIVDPQNLFLCAYLYQISYLKSYPDYYNYDDNAYRRYRSRCLTNKKKRKKGCKVMQ